MLWRRELADPMPQIEDVGRTCGVWVGVGLAKALQHTPYFGGDVLGGSKQHIGVDVALQCFARATHRTPCLLYTSDAADD